MNSTRLGRILRCFAPAAAAVLILAVFAPPAAAGNGRGDHHRGGRGGGHGGSHHGGWYGGWYGYPYWWWGSGAWWGARAHRYPLSDSPNLRAARYAALDLDVDPEDAQVLLDGTPIGIADDFDGHPDYLYLRPGTYRIEFRIPGFDTFETELRIEAGQFYELDPDLRLSSGTPRFGGGWGDEPPPAAENRFFGPNGSPAEEIDDEPADGDDEEPEDDRTEEVEREEEVTIERSTAVVDDDHPAEEEDRKIRRPRRVRERVVIEETLIDDGDSGASATLTLTVDPDDAVVWLDGERLGDAEDLAGAIETRPGAHEVVVMAPGYASRIVRVTIGAGGRASVVVSLDRIEAKK